MKVKSWSILKVQRKCFVVFLCSILLTLSFLLLNWYRSAQLTVKSQIEYYEHEIKLAERRIHSLKYMIQTAEKDVSIIAQDLGPTLKDVSTSDLRKAVRLKVFERSQYSPRAYPLLPHLRDNVNSTRPSLLISKNKSNVTFALGIPTIRRSQKSYLMKTVHNIISNMNEREKQDAVIIVFIGEMEPTAITAVLEEIQSNFSEDLTSGLLEIVAPDPSYYPDLNKLRLTLNNNLNRVKWRSKQNLDYAYLMTYAYPKAQYYIQLEDDVITVPGFLTTIHESVKSVTLPWYVIDFCELGLIGKLFKSSDLPLLATFFQMFFNDKPVDWLLDHWVDAHTCNLERDPAFCKDNKYKFWLQYKPSLFQHIGEYSSLKGKVQKLKDKHFKDVSRETYQVSPITPTEK